VGEDFTTLLFNSAKKLALCKLVAKVIMSSNSIKSFLIQQTYLSINSTISKRKAHYVNEDQEVEQQQMFFLTNSSKVGTYQQLN
jgi:hypothetical protein